MTISLQCSECGASYRVRDEFAGKLLKCHCESLIQVPAVQGVGGSPDGWSVPRELPPSPTTSWGSGGRTYAKKRVVPDLSLTIVELVAASLAIVQGMILGILHFVDFVTMTSNGLPKGPAGVVFFVILLILVTLIAAIASLCLVGFGICILIDSISRLAGGWLRQHWARRAQMLASVAYIGCHAAGAMIIFLLLAIADNFDDFFEIWFLGIGKRNPRPFAIWSVMWSVFTCAIPVFVLIMCWKRSNEA